jgi:MoaA/NifB/PqqE/SkfB family radical SAM enzyme
MRNSKRLAAAWHLAKETLSSYFLQTWDWIQLEVTSHCAAACGYCPHTVYRNNWSEQHFPLDLFRRLLPALARARLLYLQGWGEPLCHPSFDEMVSLAKSAGCRVGTSTNGMLLKESTIDSLLRTGIDFLTFSLAATGKRNDLIRTGTDIESVLNSIRLVRSKQAELGNQTLKIHIAYMLLRSELGHLNDLAALLLRVPVDQVVLSTLDFVPDSDFNQEVILPSDLAEFTQIRNRLDKVKRTAQQAGVNFHYYLGLKSIRVPTCTENIHRSAFIGVDGSLSPCVFANLPVRDVSHIVAGSSRRYRRRIFGNVGLESLDTIWRKPDYVSFRRSSGKDCPPELCAGCPKLHLTLDGDTGRGVSIGERVFPRQSREPSF